MIRTPASARALQSVLRLRFRRPDRNAALAFLRYPAGDIAHGLPTRVILAFAVAWQLLAIASTTTATAVLYGLRRTARRATELGQYELGEKLGAGGMGVVYRATHGMLRRPAGRRSFRGCRMSKVATLGIAMKHPQLEITQRSDSASARGVIHPRHRSLRGRRLRGRRRLRLRLRLRGRRRRRRWFLRLRRAAHVAWRLRADACIRRAIARRRRSRRRRERRPVRRVRAGIERREGHVEQRIHLERAAAVRDEDLGRSARHVSTTETAGGGDDDDERERQCTSMDHGKYPLSTFRSDSRPSKIGSVPVSSETTSASLIECAKSSPKASGIRARERTWYCRPMSALTPSA